MARYRPRKPKPAHRSYRKARSVGAALRDPRLSDLIGDDPFRLITEVGDAMLAARGEDLSLATEGALELPDRSFGFEDFWEDEE